MCVSSIITISYKYYLYFRNEESETSAIELISLRTMVRNHVWLIEDNLVYMVNSMPVRSTW